MGKRRGQKKQRSRINGEIPITPPQTELDSNIRAILTHLVKHLGTITIPLGELPTSGYIMWDTAQTPSGDSQITVWWAEKAKEAGNDD